MLILDKANTLVLSRDSKKAIYLLRVNNINTFLKNIDIEKERKIFEYFNPDIYNLLVLLKQNKPNKKTIINMLKNIKRLFINDNDYDYFIKLLKQNNNTFQINEFYKHFYYNSILFILYSYIYILGWYKNTYILDLLKRNIKLLPFPLFEKILKQLEEKKKPTIKNTERGNYYHLIFLEKGKRQILPKVSRKLTTYLVKRLNTFKIKNYYEFYTQQDFINKLSVSQDIKKGLSNILRNQEDIKTNENMDFKIKIWHKVLSNREYNKLFNKLDIQNRKKLFIYINDKEYKILVDTDSNIIKINNASISIDIIRSTKISKKIDILNYLSINWISKKRIKRQIFKILLPYFIYFYITNALISKENMVSLDELVDYFYKKNISIFTNNLNNLLVIKENKKKSLTKDIINNIRYIKELNLLIKDNKKNKIETIDIERFSWILDKFMSSNTLNYLSLFYIDGNWVAHRNYILDQIYFPLDYKKERNLLTIKVDIKKFKWKWEISKKQLRKKLVDIKNILSENGLVFNNESQLVNFVKEKIWCFIRQLNNFQDLSKLGFVSIKRIYDECKLWQVIDIPDLLSCITYRIKDVEYFIRQIEDIKQTKLIILNITLGKAEINQYKYFLINNKQVISYGVDIKKQYVSPILNYLNGTLDIKNLEKKSNIYLLLWNKLATNLLGKIDRLDKFDLFLNEWNKDFVILARFEKKLVLFARKDWKIYKLFWLVNNNKSKLKKLLDINLELDNKILKYLSDIEISETDIKIDALNKLFNS